MFKVLVVGFAALIILASPGETRPRYWWQQMNDGGGQAYDNQDQTVYDQAASQDQDVQDMFNQRQYDLYRREMGGGNRYPQRPRFFPEQGYNSPADTALRPHRVKRPVAKQAAAPAASGIIAQPSTGSTQPRTVLKKPVATASASPSAAPVKSGSGISCEKGAAIVASYGFLDINNKQCSGSTLVYNAVRGKSNFEVEVSAASGEVLAVRKTS